MKRAIVVGAGNMGRKWLRTTRDHQGTQPVGLVDLDQALARRVADDEGLPELLVGTSLTDVAEQVEADVVIDATIPAAHLPVTVAALRRGLAVLGEKPAAADLAEAVGLAALAELTGTTFVVSQSRRFNPQFAAVRAWLGAGARVGSLSARFSRGPHFGGFREEMESPLTVDMAVHLFDMARAITGRAPTAVYARESNPAWSWFGGDASSRAIIEFSDGVDLVFDGTWAGLGADTSWNGDWRIASDRGTVLWNGDEPATVQASAGEPTVTLQPLPEAGISLAGSLSAFLESLETGTPAENEIHDNLLTVATVETVLASARSGRRIRVADVLESARVQARASLDAWGVPEIADVLDAWPAAGAAELQA